MAPLFIMGPAAPEQALQPEDEQAVVALWERCGLTRPWNDPHIDIARKLNVGSDLFIVGVVGDEIVATAMAGYDGHRGSINYLSVAPSNQRAGLGRQIVREAERRLRALGCPKVNLQVRNENSQAMDFYRSIGYIQDEVVSFGRRLERDDVQIRAETAADQAVICSVITRAFEGLAYSSGTEQDIVDALRSHGSLTISLVAVLDRTVVGHVAFSPATPADGTPGWYALGPVSVAPDVQRQRLGHRLIEAGLLQLRRGDAFGCVVLGDIGYYARFGFRAAPEQAPSWVPGEHFMVLPFTATVPEGVIDFHEAFRTAG